MTREQVDALRAVEIDDKTIVDLIIGETAAAVTPGPAPKPEPEKQPEPEKKPEPEEKPEPEKVPEPAKQDSGKEDKILAAIEKLTGAVFARNGQTLGRETDQDNSVESILKHGFYEPEEVK